MYGGNTLGRRGRVVLPDMSTEPREIFPYTDFGQVPAGTAFAQHLAMTRDGVGIADFRPAMERIGLETADPAPATSPESDETEQTGSQEPEFSPEAPEPVVQEPAQTVSEPERLARETAAADAAALAASL